MGLHVPTAGEALVRGSRTMRWILIPVLVLFAAATLVLLVPRADAPAKMALLVGMVVVPPLTLALALFDPLRLGWAFRLFAGQMTAIVAFLSLSQGKLTTVAGVVQALLPLAFVGYPCALYALLGRFSLAKPEVVVARVGDPALEPFRAMHEVDRAKAGLGPLPTEGEVAILTNDVARALGVACVVRFADAKPERDVLFDRDGERYVWVGEMEIDAAAATATSSFTRPIADRPAGRHVTRLDPEDEDDAEA